MAIDDVFSVNVQLSIRSKEMSINVAYLQTAGADKDNVAVGLAQQYASDTLSVWLDILATDVTLQCVNVYRVNPGPSIPGAVFYDNQTGIDTGEALPSVTCPVAKWVTITADPRDNGRKFVPGISEDRVVNGVLTPAFVATEFAAWGTAHEAAIVAGAPFDTTFEPGVIQRIDAGIPVVPPELRLLDSIIVSGLLFQQLRRKTRRTAIT